MDIKVDMVRNTDCVFFLSKHINEYDPLIVKLCSMSGGSDFIRDKCPLDIPLGDRVQVPDRLIRAPRGWG